MKNAGVHIVESDATGGVPSVWRGLLDCVNCELVKGYNNILGSESFDFPRILFFNLQKWNYNKTI